MNIWHFCRVILSGGHYTENPFQRLCLIKVDLSCSTTWSSCFFWLCPNLLSWCVTHRSTYPKGVHSYRYFLQPMRTPNSLPPVHAYSPILRQNAYMHEQITKELKGRKYLYECMPFGYVNLWTCSFLYTAKWIMHQWHHLRKRMHYVTRWNTDHWWKSKEELSWYRNSLCK